MEGIVIDVSAWGARLSLPNASPVDTPVRIDVGDTMMLGDVCYCRAENGAFSVGVDLAHSVLEMPALSRLMHRLRAETAALAPSMPSQV